MVASGHERYARAVPRDLCGEHKRIWLAWRNLQYSASAPREWPGGSHIMDSRTTHAERAADWDRKSLQRMIATEDLCRSRRSPQCTTQPQAIPSEGVIPMAESNKTDKTPVELVFAATRRAPMLAKDLADAAGVSIQSASAQLKKLEKAGAVSREPETGAWSRLPGVRKLPAELQPEAPAAKDAEAPKRRRASKAEAPADAPDTSGMPAVEAEAAVADAESAAGASNVVAGPWGTPEHTDAPAGSLDAVLADMQSAAPVSAPPADSGRRARRGTGANGPAIVKGNRATQWPKGALVQALKARLDASPAGEDYSATELTKAINAARASESDPIAQTGSVAFALDKMAGAGTATLTQDAPRRYGKAAKAA